MTRYTYIIRHGKHKQIVYHDNYYTYDELKHICNETIQYYKNILGNNEVEIELIIERLILKYNFRTKKNKDSETPITALQV